MVDGWSTRARELGVRNLVPNLVDGDGVGIEDETILSLDSDDIPDHVGDVLGSDVGTNRVRVDVLGRTADRAATWSRRNTSSPALMPESPRLAIADALFEAAERRPRLAGRACLLGIAIHLAHRGPVRVRGRRADGR